MKPLCRFLEESGFLHATADGWHWTSESYPADAISLRSISSDNFVIVDEEGGPRIIGEVDFTSALTTLHEKAIYLQDGEQYQVERLDYDGRKAYVKPCNSDYYTDAISYTKVKPLETFAQEPLEAGAKSHGEVQVNTQVVGFKEDQVLHDGKRRLGRAVTPRAGDAHHGLLAYPVAGSSLRACLFPLPRAPMASSD